jgi:hypothetical protein
MIVNYDPETFIVQAADVFVSQAKKYIFLNLPWSNLIKPIGRM